MQIEQNRRSAAFARGLMRTVSSPVIEAALEEAATTAYSAENRSSGLSYRTVSPRTLRFSCSPLLSPPFCHRIITSKHNRH